MSDLNKMENPKLISLSSKSKSVPSLLLSESKNTKNNFNNPYKRLKLIENEISNKNSELIKIQNKISQIKNKEILIEKE